MRIIKLAVVVLAVPVISHADFSANITRGSVQIGGYVNANWTDSSKTKHTFSLTAAPSFEFFVTDGFSLGPAGSLTTDFDDVIHAEGASATAYLSTQGQLLPFLNLAIMTATLDNKSSFSPQIGFGAGYFISPAVSFGPELRYGMATGGKAVMHSANLSFSFRAFLAPSPTQPDHP